MPADSILVRDVGAPDADAVAALLTELGHVTDAASIPARLDALHREAGVAWIALDAHDTPLGLITLAAHAVLHAAGPVAQITSLVVTQRARGRGVGRQLVAAAKEWAASRGCVRITVTSAEHRADAHAFYPACGLPYTGRRFSASLE